MSDLWTTSELEDIATTADEVAESVRGFLGEAFDAVTVTFSGRNNLGRRLTFHVNDEGEYRIEFH